MFPTTIRNWHSPKVIARLVLVLSVLLLASSPVGAVIILGNLPSNGDNGSNPLSTTNHKAISFNMGSTDYVLDSIVLRLNRSAFAGGPTDPVVELRADSGDPLIPGLTVLSPPNPLAPASGFNDEVFTPASTFTLLADTTYWLLVRSESSAADSRLLWTASDTPGITPTGDGAILGNYRSSFDGGVNWNPSTFQNSFQINGTVVPEPATALMLALGLAGVGYVRTGRGPRLRAR